MGSGYATPKSASAKPAARKAAPQPAQRPAPTLAGYGLPLQTKLEVGPANDRFEQEADRVAAHVASAATASAGPPPAISALGGAAPAAAKRKTAQRAEEAPVTAREQKPEEIADVAEVLQRKPGVIQRDDVDDDTTAETTIAQGKRDTVQRKDEKSFAPQPEKPEVEEVVQAKRGPGVIQRDDVDDDTVAETTIAQGKRDTASLQRAVARADAVLVETEPKEEEPVVDDKIAPAQRDAAVGGGAFAAPSAVEASVNAMRGGGAPLGPDLRGYMEPRFGRDFSGVRVHSGADAAAASRAVGARAFTVGQDIFFGPGQYRPQTDGGRRLLAHELTHTVQQGGGSAQAQPYRIQRNGAAANASQTTPSETPPSKVFENAKGKIDATDPAAKKIELPALPIPQILKGIPKGAPGGVAPGVKDGARNAIPSSPGTAFEYKGKTPRGGLTARQNWLGQTGKSSSAIESKIKEIPNAEKSGVKAGASESAAPVVYLKRKQASARGAHFLMIGTTADLSKAPEILIPIWDSSGSDALFDVDHIQELQLGGLDGWENFWLLDQGSNRSSGSNINREISTGINELVNDAGAAGYWVADRGGEDKPSFRKVKTEGSTWSLTFRSMRFIEVSGTKKYWTRDAILTGKHLDKLEAMTAGQIAQEGLAYDKDKVPSTVSIFPQKLGGGFRRRLDVSNPANVRTADGLDQGGGASAGPTGKQFYKGFSYDSLTYEVTKGQTLTEDQKIGNIHGQPFKSTGAISGDPFDIPILWSQQFGFGGYINNGFIKERMGRLSIVGASPIEIQDAGVSPDGSLYARGEIVATKALFPNLRIPIFLRGNDVYISFPIPTDRLHFGPLSVTEAALSLGFGKAGIFAEGYADVAIAQVGSGRIEGRVDKAGPVITGMFNFDLDFLNPAQASVIYKMADDSLTLTLTAGVQAGKLPGVESGTVTATISRDSVSVGGTLNLLAPLQGTSLTVSYTKEAGLLVAANDIPLPLTRIPGVKDARASVAARRNPETGEWTLSGGGSATIDVPPAQGTLAILINGRSMTITGAASFTKGPASGSLSFTATNQATDAEGNPVEGEVSENFTVTGRGSAAMQFGILKGTAGIELTPDARILVSGEIALPPTHEVFAKRSYEKELLHISPPEFPIWGVSVAGYGIGIFAFIDAYLRFDAFVGPGTLQNTAVKVTFDIDKPEEAVVDGTADFVVPAGAGFTLDIGGGLRARIAVASVEGRVGLDARLGLLAEARAGVDLHWSKAEGLSLAAEAEAKARPQFDIGVNASVTAKVDLWVTDISHTWGPWRKQLGSFGPGLEVGVKVPIAWSEMNGLDFDTDKIQITKPDVDFGAVMKDTFLSLV